MRKVLIVIAFGLSGLTALAAVQPASAKDCKQVCDQWQLHNGKLRCFSSHSVCTGPGSPVSNSGGGAQQPIQNQKSKYQN